MIIISNILLLVPLFSILIEPLDAEIDSGFEDDFLHDRMLFFTYYSREFPEGIDIVEMKQFSKYIDRTKPTKIITHGWMSDGFQESCISIKTGFLYRYDANILILNWDAAAASPWYIPSAIKTKKVGKQYGRYLNYFIDELGVVPQDIHLVGHSLGAYASGIAAREVKNGKVGRITGLDPSYPFFGWILLPTLSRRDASFVDVIHTDAGALGHPFPLGHADFYVNGGKHPQPGCDLEGKMQSHSCSHRVSWNVFASSFFMFKPLIARKCSNYRDIMEFDEICTGVEVPIGYLTPATARGAFYCEVLLDDLRFPQ